MRQNADALLGRDSGDWAGITVIVITLNEEMYIADCLDSLLRLDYPEERHEIIVVDASTDSTPEIVRRYPRVRYIAEKKGFSRQKNTGVQAAAFGNVAFTDADCLVPSDWLRIIHRALVDPHRSGIGGNAFPPPGSGYFATCSAAIGHPAGGAVGFDANVSRGPDGVAFIAGCNCVLRKSALMVAGGFSPAFNDGGEDVDISRRLRQLGHYLDYIPELTVYHRPRPTMKAYVRWNIGVGHTKFNLTRPGWLRLIAQPGFFLWPLLGAAGMIAAWLHSPWLWVRLALLGWLALLGFLTAFTRPYPRLMQRRRWLGLGLISILTVIPLLILIRQVAMHWGQLRKWFRVSASIRA